MNWLKRHFQKYREREAWKFCWLIGLEGTVVSLAIALFLSLFDVAEREIDLSFEELLILGVLVAPILETLIFQAFFVWIARLCKAGFGMQVIASVIPFFAAHVVEGVATGLAAGLVGGFYFAFTYVHWREKSRWTAFWVTALSHALHNGILIPLAAAFGEI